MLFQIKVIAAFLIIFGAHMNILFIMKENIFVLIKWSQFEHIVKYILNTCLVDIHFLSDTYSNTIEIRVVYLMTI